MATTFFGGGMFGGEFFNGGPPAAGTFFQGPFFQGGFFDDQGQLIIPARAGGDSTRRRKRRPLYYWEAARKAKKEEVAEVLFDAIAVAYEAQTAPALENHLQYLAAVEAALRRARFEDLAHQVEIGLKTLTQRLEMMEAAELHELLEIL